MSDAERTRIDEANAEFLRVVAALEEHVPQRPEEDAAIAQEIRRLEFKLDLMLEMVGRLLARQLDLPRPVPVRLSATHIEWTDSPPLPPPGERIHVELYLHPEYPHPLYLPGQVESVREHPEGLQARVRFDPPGEEVQGWLEKTIFRHHRRRIAHSRRPA